MARTDATEVQGILGVNYDGSASLTRYINAAHAMVNWIANVCDTAGVNDADQLTLIETWLAAHYYQAMDPGYTSKSTGGASGSFKGQTGKYFEATDYGQRALELDLAGCLLKKQQELMTGNKKSARMLWGGSTQTEQDGYDDRYA
jgi:hypothetical protein